MVLKFLFDGVVMDSINRPRKRAYSLPTLRKLNREQAALFLLGHAWDGHPGAQELLKLVFPEPSDEHQEQKAGASPPALLAQGREGFPGRQISMFEPH